jgi:hypothetical protein
VSERWVVDFDGAAVGDFEDVKAKDERRAVFTAVDKLRQLGPKLGSPHVKSLSGEPDLFELRPRGGSSKTRPIFIRQDEGYLIVAIATDHARNIDRAIADSRVRLRARGR